MAQPYMLIIVPEIIEILNLVLKIPLNSQIIKNRSLNFQHLPQSSNGIPGRFIAAAFELFKKNIKIQHNIVIVFSIL